MGTQQLSNSLRPLLEFEFHFITVQRNQRMKMNRFLLIDCQREKLQAFKVNNKAATLLKMFILQDGFKKKSPFSPHDLILITTCTELGGQRSQGG